VSEARVVGRYAIFGPIAAGGTATVHFGRLIGPVGFQRSVVVKRIATELADDADKVDALVKDTKAAARVRHPNVISTSDVVATNGEILLVMDYVEGESAARMFRTLRERTEAFPSSVAVAIFLDALRGLAAVHALDMLHDAVCPMNILVGVDGEARLVNFGVAKLLPDEKAMVGYSSPRKISGVQATRATDIWAAGVVLWELLTGKPLYPSTDDEELKKQILESPFEAPSKATAGDPERVAAYDAFLEKALAPDPENRFASAAQMADELEKIAPVAAKGEVAAFVEEVARQALDIRKMGLAAVESALVRGSGPPSAPSAPRPPGSGTRARVVFGIVMPPTANVIAPRVDELTEWLGDEVGLEVVRRDSKSYESLAMAVREGKVDLAWLPPIVYVRIIEGVTPVGSIQRGGKTSYEAALIVRADAKTKSVDALRGSRAGWVDPWSAAGFVLPRIKLAILGVDPRRLFRTERFHGSHHGAIEALIEGACDVAGTYSRTNDKGEVVTGAWTEVEGADVRVLTTFGAIPPDVLAVRRNMLPATHEKVLEALRAASKNDEARPLLRAIFGGEDLVEEIDKGYDGLRNALDGAISRGLFD
jgi:phosphate/phosphite/phosphonate ABC transporter binding protein